MKLNANKFTGKLENGDRYKISVKTNYHKSIKQYNLRVEFHVTNERLLNTWQYDADKSCSIFFKKGGYKKALRDGLIFMENNLEIQLLKAELEVA